MRWGGTRGSGAGPAEGGGGDLWGRGQGVWAGLAEGAGHRWGRGQVLWGGSRALGAGLAPEGSGCLAPRRRDAAFQGGGGFSPQQARRAALAASCMPIRP